jgi:hypothetical protein
MNFRLTVIHTLTRCFSRHEVETIGNHSISRVLAPPEVHQSILDLRKKRVWEKVDSHDVICWLLEQTCVGVEQLQPLFFSQGADFCRRMQASVDNANFLGDVRQRENFLQAIRTIEQQTLEQLYGVSSKGKGSRLDHKFSPRLASFMKELKARKSGFQDTGDAVHGSALQEVEQEREVAYEGQSSLQAYSKMVLTSVQLRQSVKCRSLSTTRRMVSAACIAISKALWKLEDCPQVAALALKPLHMLARLLSVANMD